MGKKGNRKIRLRGKIKIKRKEKVYHEITELINKGTISTNELAVRVHLRRYLVVMAWLGIVKLDKLTGRLETKRISCGDMSRDQFLEIPEIIKWRDDCIARQIKPRTISKYVKTVRYMFRLVKGDPKNVVSSKKSALEFWTKFIVEYRKRFPTKGTQNYRVSFKNFIASFDILFAPRMGKIYGLSSAHDSYGAYAEVSLSPEITKKIGDMILANNDLQLYTWWRVGLRTGARSKAISTMVWERVYFNEKT